MAATVTIDQAYFETLLRRAEFHTTGRDLRTPVDVPLVNIPKVDHDNLLLMAREYNCLRQALYRGGIERETLETLITGQQSLLDSHVNSADSDGLISPGTTLFSRPQAVHVSLSRSQGASIDLKDPFGSRGQRSGSADGGSGAYKGSRGSYSRHNSCTPHEDNAFTPDYEIENGYFPTPRFGRRYERDEQRTLVARNLHERTTHKDIVDFLRGGSVLDIYLRAKDRTASVSFVEGQHAEKFMSHVKRNDIYIHGKRVEWAWNDRQFILPAHVANKINNGATRNLVIRNCPPNITEEKLREDLDHIHNLVIIDISYVNGDCHISLNSIHNSLFARTCMMSRSTYKGMKIEWSEDECSLPLPEPKQVKEDRPKKKNNNTSKPINRFQMLGIDGDDTEDGQDDNDDITTTTNMTSLTLNARTPWDVSSSVAA